MVIVRPAHPSESEALTSLAFAAKAFWGYTRQQLDAWSNELCVTAESILQEPTFVAEDQGRVLGVVQLDTSSTSWQVACLWVHPDGTRQGIGARLVREAVAYAHARGQRELQINADPHAEGFYLRMGAHRVGVLSAPLAGSPDRVRPQLVLATDRSEASMSASDGCPKCGGAMSRGFVVDHNMGAATVGLWVEGEPVHIRWGSGVKAPRELSIPIATFRCAGCGFLQSYARPEFAEKH